jgi:hypothetical protein
MRNLLVILLLVALFISAGCDLEYDARATHEASASAEMTLVATPPAQEVVRDE